jgi:hypothetical protein
MSWGLNPVFPGFLGTWGHLGTSPLGNRDVFPTQVCQLTYPILLRDAHPTEGCQHSTDGFFKLKVSGRNHKTSSNNPSLTNLSH